jgi:hypothetical protein
MKTRAYSGVLLCVAALGLCTSHAQAKSWPQADQNWCSARQWSSNGLVTHAETREQRLGNSSENYVNPGGNGSIKVHGWNNGDILVKACIYASAESEGEARQLASQVQIVEGAGRITPSGPSRGSSREWSVSYEIWMPDYDSVELAAHNGSLHVDGMNGKVRFHTENGSVRLSNIGGNVDGSTTNGSLTVDASNNWKGDEMRVRTTNGSLHLNFPENFSAQVRASTVNGRVHTDFPATVQGNLGRGNNLSFQIGSGGPIIEAHTVNGSVHIGRGA